MGLRRPSRCLEALDPLKGLLSSAGANPSSPYIYKPPNIFSQD